MYLVALSNIGGRPDYWTYQEHELVEMLTFRDELREKGKDLLILHIPSFPNVVVHSLFDVTEGND